LTVITTVNVTIARNEQRRGTSLPAAARPVHEEHVTCLLT
jgi:hypothetical protein